MTFTPFKLERYFAQHEFTARYLLCSSDPESMSVSDLLAYEPGSSEGLARTWLGYTEYPGAPALRVQLAKELYTATQSDQIIVHTGAQEAIYSFMNAVLEPGDHLIVHMPGYQSHYSTAQDRGLAVTPWMARESSGWALDIDELATLIRPETKALVVCFPHNPTGYLPSTDEFDAIIEFARRHGLMLFSDEVYRGLELDPAHRLPAACDVYERAVSLGALAKSHGLAGLRIGWVATRDREVLRRMSLFKDYLTISNSAPSEYLATIAVRQTDALTRRATDITRANLQVLDTFFARHEAMFEWRKPLAGTIAFPRLRNLSAYEFCETLLEQTGVLLLPSTLLDYGDANFRIGFGRKNLPQILPIVDDYLGKPGGTR
ncbi:aminotransferase class I/II-fold pyridoxal phosphate-dependent enzyme [Paraburkholderia rhizosphaerae]|uniref:Aspartate/methionine/tyrosine aminotransferase n=1 Tax=Paraburkholderia rhizosphaerae TaxID=480658 RepID=A0A4R8LK34_9BURK|nr:aminotransferase class I/II-fold pyridoxal phosphate-dependent enzyme [Paraburkholderia rhizosphaerae]TDY44426.1 aspartate/methionine/tyrosine aminotransferase [Paraburkholderia rhizosphaerae]